MRRANFFSVGIVLLAFCSVANATTFRFDTDPFAGTTALTDPGRQIIGNEAFITFSIPADLFSLESTVFLGVGPTVQFVNTMAAGIPSSGVNIIVLQTFDDDGNPATNFAAGNAANLIASQIMTPGPGFFIYFNQGLDLPRLVFSTDLNDNTADLKVLFRMTNLTGQAGRDAMPTFTAANFVITVPEPSTLVLTVIGLMSAGFFRRKRT
jgi:hypothetical protein